MNRSHKVILAVVLVAAGTSGSVFSVVVLAGQGLDRAEKIVSIGGVITSLLFAAAGLWLGWLTWRYTTAPPPPPPLPAPGPSVNASGPGAVAVGETSSDQITTEVSGTAAALASTGADGVNATGAGSVAVGRNSTGSIRTKVTGADHTMP